MRRVLFGGAVVVACVLGSAAPASADPARPTNYESTVTRIEPATDVVTVEVVGGDSFLHLRVEPGHEVVVYGYENPPEPYLRVSADGTVEQNLRSPAVVLNTDRYASVGGQPADVDPSAEPRWERVATGGAYVWHDHRSHWMGRALPPQLGGSEHGVVFDDWRVPMRIDGTETTVHGRLVRDAPPSALPWLGLAAVIAAAGGALALRRPRVVVLGAALAAASAFAVVVSAPGQFGLPSAAGRQHHLWIVPAIALAASIGALLWRRTAYAIALVAGAALTLPLWVFGTFAVVTHAHAATAVAEPLQRSAVAVAIGAIGAAAVVAAASIRPPRVLAAPASTDDALPGR
jgi:hypothetical protein